jgi:hypothetical protein
VSNIEVKPVQPATWAELLERSQKQTDEAIAMCRTWARMANHYQVMFDKAIKQRDAARAELARMKEDRK